MAEVVKGAYPDPTADDPQWVAVDLKPVKPLATSVQFAAIRYDKRLSQLPLIRQSQLSVMPLTKDEFDVIVSMGSSKATQTAITQEDENVQANRLHDDYRFGHAALG